VVLTPELDVSAAAWITNSDLPWQQLVAFGPSGFEAYARLLFLPDPTSAGQQERDLDPEAPSERELLSVALSVLRRHTRTPDDCYFCRWDGWGADTDGDDDARITTLEIAMRPPHEISRETRDPTRSARPSPAIAPDPSHVGFSGPKVVVPNRAYFLFHGSLSELDDREDAKLSLSPAKSETFDAAFVWPADHAWCIAKDVDSHYAGIGAASGAIDELLAHPDLDVVPADAHVEPPHYG